MAEEFKISLVNVQDPIELSHNVTQNVSEHYLKLLRGESMRVIYNLKTDSSDPVLAMFAKKFIKRPKAPGPVEQSMEVDSVESYGLDVKRIKLDN